MAEERKQYEVKGTVTISTEEYRDLITERYEANNDADRYRRMYWDEQSVASDLKKKVEALENGQKNYRDFINSDETITKTYKDWLISKQDDEI